MTDSQKIVLDAVICGVLSKQAFRAELSNGHELIAFGGAGEQARVQKLKAGDRVRVEMSPYDMSRGRLLFDAEEEDRDESA